ncbi:MAG: tRNA threonylcarbamoyladenosine dehydratase [Eubacteriaceae bacterium]|jgi:tRNA A37 threonylcarbamoyladenosine dehydratase
MKPERTTRTRRMIGDNGDAKLAASRVLLFGIGGVGSYAAEALIRSGTGSLTIVDKDVVDESNINRQLIALGSTVGMAKTEAAAARFRDISPETEIITFQECFTPENADFIDFSDYDYVIDAVDMVTAKLEIIRRAKEAGVPVITVMGTGNKLHPERLQITDISKTSICPLAKVMRRELKNRGIRGVEAVWSDEVPAVRCTPPGSLAPVPGTAGLIAASRVISSLLEDRETEKPGTKDRAAAQPETEDRKSDGREPENSTRDSAADRTESQV